MTAYATKEAMQEALTRSFELMRSDAPFRQGTQKAHLSIGFEIDDLDLTFVIALDHGIVATTLGGSPEDADVQLAMSSEAYDRIFTGELSPMKAALFGDLSFSGDIPAATRLQGLLPEMIRVYTQAKTAN